MNKLLAGIAVSNKSYKKPAGLRLNLIMARRPSSLIATSTATALSTLRPWPGTDGLTATTPTAGGSGAASSVKSSAPTPTNDKLVKVKIVSSSVLR